MGMTIRADLQGLGALLADLGDELKAAARPAAQAAAQVFYDEAKRNVQALGRITGRLDRAVYQKHVDEEAAAGRSYYRISWNKKTAPHGHLVEAGYVQRYATYVGKDGKWHLAVRPEARGKPKPARNAPQSVRDAYYVLRKGGPVQIPGKAFIRRAATKHPQALDAAEKVLQQYLDKAKNK